MCVYCPDIIGFLPVFAIEVRRLWRTEERFGYSSAPKHEKRPTTYAMGRFIYNIPVVINYLAHLTVQYHPYLCAYIPGS
jgi:hypothetical protein